MSIKRRISKLEEQMTPTRNQMIVTAGMPYGFSEDERDTVRKRIRELNPTLRDSDVYCDVTRFTYERNGLPSVEEVAAGVKIVEAIR